MQQLLARGGTDRESLAEGLQAIPAHGLLLAVRDLLRRQEYRLLQYALLLSRSGNALDAFLRGVLQLHLDDRGYLGFREALPAKWIYVLL